MQKNSKKLLMLLILVLCMTAFAACSKDDSEPVTPTESVTKEPAGTSTQDVTDAPKPTETFQSTPEPTSTPVPTATPVPTEEPVVTAEPISAGDTDDNELKPTVTDTEGGSSVIDSDIEEDDGTILPVEVVYHQFKGTGRPLSAQGGKIAKSFVQAFYEYDADKVVSLLAYDGSNVEEINDVYTIMNDMKKTMENAGDFSSLIKTEIIGGETIDLEENLESIQMGAMVDVESTCSDLEVFTACVSTTISGYEDYGKSYMNIVVGKYEGEYKVINTIIVNDTENSDSDPDNFNATPTPTPMPIDYSEMLYKFTGNETADDIAKLFAESYSKLDVITMYSCIAMDEKTMQEAFGQLDSSMLLQEDISAYINEDTFKINLGEAEALDDAELKELEPRITQVDWADVSDVVKYKMHIDMSLFDQTSSMDSYLYIGKYKGEYRVVYANIFDEY